jgi:hypothetical protein
MEYGNQVFELFFTKTTLIRAILVKTAQSDLKHFGLSRFKNPKTAQFFYFFFKKNHYFF